jgi:hypothetical protein
MLEVAGPEIPYWSNNRLNTQKRRASCKGRRQPAADQFRAVRVPDGASSPLTSFFFFITLEPRVE